MRKLVIAISTLVALATVAAAQDAGIHINKNTKVTEPITGLAPDDWAYVIENSIDIRDIVGKPVVWVINATGDGLADVKCGGYQLIGNSRYWPENAPDLPAWKTSKLKANKFDNYCKDGLTATGISGKSYTGQLNAKSGRFTDATFAVFLPNGIQRRDASNN